MIGNLTETKLQFNLLAQIGEGGEAQVYEALDTQLNANIAIKRVPIINFADPNLFFEESKKLYLTTHHNVVKIIYGCQDNDFIYLAMPLYKNGSLKSLIDSRFLTSREIIRYSLQFLSGINNIHSKGLIHFDIKPENILLSSSNQALISDFGLAQFTGQYGFAQNYGTTQVLAPPELFSQPNHNLKFDLYQAGLAIYRLCNGDKIFFEQINSSFESKGNRSEAIFIKNVEKGSFPDRKFFLPHISNQLRKVVKKALKIDPNDRYSSTIEMLNDLSKINSANDWVYTNDNLGNEEWQITDYQVTCVEDNNKFTILALKNQRRVTQYCKTVDTISEKNELLYDCLNS